MLPRFFPFELILLYHTRLPDSINFLKNNRNLYFRSCSDHIISSVFSLPEKILKCDMIEIFIDQLIKSLPHA